jgi:hypothetical protein
MPYFLEMEPSGSIYRANRMAARIEPWGTPHDTGDEVDLKFHRLTEKVLSDR